MELYPFMGKSPRNLWIVICPIGVPCTAIACILHIAYASIRHPLTICPFLGVVLKIVKGKCPTPVSCTSGQIHLDNWDKSLPGKCPWLTGFDQVVALLIDRLESPLTSLTYHKPPLSLSLLHGDILPLDWAIFNPSFWAEPSFSSLSQSYIIFVSSRFPSTFFLHWKCSKSPLKCTTCYSYYHKVVFAH